MLTAIADVLFLALQAISGSFLLYGAYLAARYAVIGDIALGRSSRKPGLRSAIKMAN